MSPRPSTRQPSPLQRRRCRRPILAALVSFGLGTGAAADSKEDPTDVTIYCDQWNIMSINEKGNVGVERLALVESYLGRGGLHWTFQCQPWNRALASAHADPKGLILGLLRTPEREESYHWLIPVSESWPVTLYALAGNARPGISRKDWLAGNSMVACEKGTAYCGALREAGLPETRIIESPVVSKTHLEQLLLRERVDYYVSSPAFHDLNTKALELAPGTIVPVLKLAERRSWLAADKGLDAGLLARLRQISVSP